ncbi:MAG TPA: hypothetical protein PKL88_03275 [bacterium]|nr:hypothetical protein [bacterium]
MKEIRITKNISLGGDGEELEKVMFNEAVKEFEQTKFYKWLVKIFNRKEINEYRIRRKDK